MNNQIAYLHEFTWNLFFCAITLIRARNGQGAKLSGTTRRNAVWRKYVIGHTGLHIN